MKVDFISLCCVALCCWLLVVNHVLYFTSHTMVVKSFVVFGIAAQNATAMGRKRHERQAASKRPAAKLGGGGGWNLNDRDPNDSTPVPEYPGVSADASKPWEEPRPIGDRVSPTTDTTKPTKRAFSGTGWRVAAPGFDPKNPGQSLEPSTLPKVLLGNLPCDVAPELLRSLLHEKCDSINLGDADGELVSITVAVFGPARPKLKRDKKREHRGFAVGEYSTRGAAEAAAAALNESELHSPSARNRMIKASADVGAAMDAAFLAGCQGEDVVVRDGETGDTGDGMNKKEIDRKLDPASPLYDPPFAMSEIKNFPMRLSCLATHTTLRDLDEMAKKRLYRYLTDAIPGVPELVDVIKIMESVAPRWTRVKELMESVEAFLVITSFMTEAERQEKKVVTFFDLACGHGFVGLLFAFCFPDKVVKACDFYERPAFKAYGRVLGALASCEANGVGFSAEKWIAENQDKIDQDLKNPEEGDETMTNKGTETVPDWVPSSNQPPQKGSSSNQEDEQRCIAFLNKNLPGSSLENVKFTEGDLNILADAINENSFVVALHGCNESTRDAVEIALTKNALWCVMPCCVVKDLYLPMCVLSRLNDASRYAFIVGALAQKYKASYVRSIDGKITNRTLMVFGGLQSAESTAGSNGQVTAPSQPPQGPFTLRFPMAHNKPVARVAARREVME